MNQIITNQLNWVKHSKDICWLYLLWLCILGIHIIYFRKSIVATASDDFTWKIWTLPNGELIMSGEGHKDWISGIDFHPRGSHLVTSSGDCTIKVCIKKWCKGMGFH
jgi:WD40 repeat protein